MEPSARLARSRYAQKKQHVLKLPMGAILKSILCLPVFSLIPVQSHSQSNYEQTREAFGWPRWRTSLWILMLICWLIEAWSYRHLMTPDGVSYIDIATSCAKGDWGALINAYWSPAYPVVLMLWWLPFRPTPYWQLPLTQILNCLILMVALCCLEYLLNGLIAYQARSAAADRETEPLPAWSLRAIGYTLFFWVSIFLTPPSLDTPDAMILAFVLLAAGMIVRIRDGKAGWLRFAVLGGVLGLAYLTKAVMFPLAFVFLCSALLGVGNFRRAIPRVLLTVLIFLLVSGPFVAALSKSKGRLTYGDTGGIAYAVFVNGAWFYRQGDPASIGVLKHPLRKLLDEPPVFEFATPIGGTHPPLHDASYWYDGVRPHFVLKGQLIALRGTLETYFSLFVRLSGFFGGFIVLLFCGSGVYAFARQFLRETFLWLPGAAGFALYALVFVDLRHVAGFVVLVGIALFSALYIASTDDARAIVRPATLSILILLGAQIAWSTGHSATRLAQSRPFPEWEVAKKLQQLRVQTGDRVATVGISLSDHYWAQLAGVRIVSEIPEEAVSSYWGADPALKLKVQSLFAGAGAKVIVTRNLPPVLLADGWENVPGTDYYLLTIQR
jgi:4-amino-4-deoxy-L-arabinose transferase-like glycosyltransferase